MWKSHVLTWIVSHGVAFAKSGPLVEDSVTIGTSTSRAPESGKFLHDVQPHFTGDLEAKPSLASGRLAKCKFSTRSSQLSTSTAVRGRNDEVKVQNRTSENKTEANEIHAHSGLSIQSNKTEAKENHASQMPVGHDMVNATHPVAAGRHLSNASLLHTGKLQPDSVTGSLAPVPVSPQEKYPARHHKPYEVRDFVLELWNDDVKKKRAFIAIGLFFVSTLIVQQILWILFSRMTRTAGKQSSAFFVETTGMFRCIFFCGAAFVSTMTANFALDYSPQVANGKAAVEEYVRKTIAFIGGIFLSAILHDLHDRFERLLNPPLTVEEIGKQSFMHTLCSPTGIEQPVADELSLENSIFTYVWTPFYMVTQGVLWLVLLLWLFDYRSQIIVVAVFYFGVSGLGVVFGANTLGKDLYGGILLLMERPFEIGDLVSIENKGGAGGVQDTIVTGFVERIRIRSTVIRRFDMRACQVPNHLLAEMLVSNWKRPRKLIFFTFGISHRSPLSGVKLFSEKAMFTVKNHPDVDPTCYTKACFRKLDSGYNFQVVCFNNPGTKKQFVQQDLIYRISAIAHDLGIVMTFDEKSVSVQREQIDKYYQEEDSLHLSADLSGIVPAKKEKANVEKIAPKGTLLIRVDHLSGKGLCTSDEQGNWRQQRFFVKVSHPVQQYNIISNVQQSEGEEMCTSLQHVDPKTNTVSWFESLGFEKDPKVPVPVKVLIQVYMKVGFHSDPSLIAEERVNMAAVLEMHKSEPEPLRLTPMDEDCHEDLMITIKFFLGKDLSFEKQQKRPTLRHTSSLQFKPPSSESQGNAGTGTVGAETFSLGEKSTSV